MIAFSIALALIAQPVPTPAPAFVLPALSWKTPAEVEDEWRAVRKAGDDKKKLEAIRRASLDGWACKGLIELQALPDAGGLAWKDTVRGRTWARPALARILIQAHKAWQAEHPTHVIAVGDVAQAGCGQIDPGVLTRVTLGDEASALRDAAATIFGIPTIREIVDALTLADADRFVAADRVMIERRLVAEDAGALLSQLRRYRALPDPDRARRVAFTKEVQAIVDAGTVALETRIVEPDGTKWYRQTIVDPLAGMQVVVVRKNRGKRFWLEDARDVRVGFWLPARPGVFPGEQRWLGERDACRSEAQPNEAGCTNNSVTQWTAWELVVEGAHATHMAGRDADLSYPIAAELRFTNAPDRVDLAATWAWFETLVATGEALGTPVERIIVGPRLHARILRDVKGARTSKLITDKIVRVVREHDDHQHIRIAEPTAEADQLALDVLTSR